MFDILPESGEKVLKYSRSLLGESPSKVVDKGIEILEKNSGILEEAGGILGDILDRRKREPREEKPGEP
jgi:hypothetical protein